MDRRGEFIPLATKRIFLKYYSSENGQHYCVWTKDERESYSDEIRRCIELYKPVIIEENEK